MIPHSSTSSCRAHSRVSRSITVNDAFIAIQKFILQVISRTTDALGRPET